MSPVPSRRPAAAGRQASVTPVAPIAPARDGGSDRGHAARERLLAQASRIFAAKGFAAAATREICEAAGLNVASIHYYFGDKEGLYREVLLRPIAQMVAAFGAFDDPALDFEQSIRMFLAPFLHPGGDTAAEDDAQLMRLHLREMLEPSAVFRELTAQTIVPLHRRLCGVLARHAGLAAADTDIHQMAFALAAMANDYCMSREFMKLLAPDVLDRPQAMERILDRLVGYARALLDHEIARRRSPTRNSDRNRHASSSPPAAGRSRPAAAAGRRR